MSRSVLSYALSLSTGAFTSPMRAAQGTVTKFASQLGNIGNIATGLASIPGAINTLVAPLSKPITLAADMESLNEEMAILIGSAPKASQMLKDIKSFADVTPFQMQGLVENAKTLLGFGASTKSIMPSLKMLGDVAGSSSDRMERLTLAYAQITASGKLMGQDLLQLINAGFNPLQEISRTTGQSMASLRDQMEKGAVSSEMVASAFKSATSAGGRFFGNTAAQGRTFHGVVSTLGDAWNDINRSFGDPTMLALKPIIKDMTAMAVELKPLAADFGKALSTVLRG